MVLFYNLNERAKFDRNTLPQFIIFLLCYISAVSAGAFLLLVHET